MHLVAKKYACTATECAAAMSVVTASMAISEGTNCHAGQWGCDGAAWQD
jgi:hypothetical protein